MHIIIFIVTVSLAFGLYMGNLGVRSALADGASVKDARLTLATGTLIFGAFAAVILGLLYALCAGAYFLATLAL